MFTAEKLAADNMAFYITELLDHFDSLTNLIQCSFGSFSQSWQSWGRNSTKFELRMVIPYTIINSYYWRNLARLNSRWQYAFTLDTTISILFSHSGHGRIYLV
jgi:hypothetical protein